jgi:hypothetical protein
MRLGSKHPIEASAGLETLEAIVRRWAVMIRSPAACASFSYTGAEGNRLPYVLEIPIRLSLHVIASATDELIAGYRVSFCLSVCLSVLACVQ